MLLNQMATQEILQILGYSGVRSKHVELFMHQLNLVISVDFAQVKEK